VGYEGASVNAIAARSGLDKQLIFHYFGNKRGLYDAVLENMFTQTLPAACAGIGDVLATSLGFEQSREWVRLLGWEGLQYDGGEVPFARQCGEAVAVLQQHDVRVIRRCLPAPPHRARWPVSLPCSGRALPRQHSILSSGWWLV
jgi:AcrR family transcriptional regulator